MSVEGNPVIEIFAFEIRTRVITGASGSDLMTGYWQQLKSIVKTTKHDASVLWFVFHWHCTHIKSAVLLHGNHLYLVRVKLYQRIISLLFTQLNKYRSSTTFIRAAKSCNSSIAKCPTSHSGAPHSRKFETFGKIEKYRSWHSSFLIGAIGVCWETNSANEKQSSSLIRGANWTEI